MRDINRPRLVGEVQRVALLHQHLDSGIRRESVFVALAAIAGKGAISGSALEAQQHWLGALLAMTDELPASDLAVAIWVGAIHIKCTKEQGADCATVAGIVC